MLIIFIYSFSVLLLTTIPSLFIRNKISDTSKFQPIIFFGAIGNAIIAMQITGGISYLLDSIISYLIWFSVMYSLTRFANIITPKNKRTPYYIVVLALKSLAISLFLVVLFLFLSNPLNRVFAEITIIALAIFFYFTPKHITSLLKSHNNAI